MPHRSKTSAGLLVRFLRRMRDWGQSFSRPGGCCAAAPRAEYPIYLPCPHCGEPEVEVWSCEEMARCHQCEEPFPCPE